MQFHAQKRAGVHVHDMQIARCMPNLSPKSAGVRILGPKLSALGPNVYKISTLRQKLKVVTQKRAGVHVHDPKMGVLIPKSGTGPKNWAQI
jgi:hypothetical protein